LTEWGGCYLRNVGELLPYKATSVHRKIYDFVTVHFHRCKALRFSLRYEVLKPVNIKITVLWDLVLYGCETWSLTYGKSIKTEDVREQGAEENIWNEER
jgi:hypothetical protein